MSDEEQSSPEQQSPEQIFEHTISNYGDFHRAVLQHLMSIKKLAEPDLALYMQRALLASIVNDAVENGLYEGNQLVIDFSQALTESHVPFSEGYPFVLQNYELTDPFHNINGITSVIDKINKKLHHLDFEIVRCSDQDDINKRLFIFVNKSPNGSIKLSTSYTEKQIEYINKVIEEMFINPNIGPDGKLTYSVSKNRARNLGIEGNISAQDASFLLNDLESRGWFEVYKLHYTLTSRCLMELKPYLTNKYELKAANNREGTVSRCEGCKEIMTRGLACPNEDCYVRYHKGCFELSAGTRETDNCPNNRCTKSIDLFYSFY